LLLHEKSRLAGNGLEPDEGARAVASKEHSIELFLPGAFNLSEKRFDCHYTLACAGACT
jgi:hypothetical protein